MVAIVVFSALLALSFDEARNSRSLSDVGPGTCPRDRYPDDIVVRISCAKAHGSEAIGTVTHPAPPGAPYPPGFDLNFQALDACRGPFTEYVGVPSEESPKADRYAQFPSEREWRRGARAIVCFAVARGRGRAGRLRARSGIGPLTLFNRARPVGAWAAWSPPPRAW